MILNDTLLRHLPEELRNPKDNFEAQRLAVRAQENVRKRAELNHPEDVMGASTLIVVVNDLFSYYSDSPPRPHVDFNLVKQKSGEYQKQPAQWFRATVGYGPFGEENLLWQIWHGLLIPRYLIRNYDASGKERGPISGILPAPRLAFNKAGSLQNITITIQKPLAGQLAWSRQFGYGIVVEPSKIKQKCHRLAWYRKHNYLVERPSAKAAIDAWPKEVKRQRRGSNETYIEGITIRGIALFTFKQAMHVLNVHRLMYSTLNWLSMPLAKYQSLRADVLQQVQHLLRDEGAPSPRFCKNETCRAILPATTSLPSILSGK